MVWYACSTKAWMPSQQKSRIGHLEQLSPLSRGKASQANWSNLTSEGLRRAISPAERSQRRRPDQNVNIPLHASEKEVLTIPLDVQKNSARDLEGHDHKNQHHDTTEADRAAMMEDLAATDVAVAAAVAAGKSRSQRLYKEPLSIESLMHEADMGAIIFVDCRPYHSVPLSLVTGSSNEKDPKSSKNGQLSSARNRHRRSGTENSEDAKSIVNTAYVTIPIWLSIPGFIPLRVYVKKRAFNRSQFYGKRIIAVDNNGVHASAFMANQARCKQNSILVRFQYDTAFLTPNFQLVAL